MKKLLLLLLISQLLACSSGIEGTYMGGLFGSTKYEFNKNGIVTVTDFGTTVEMEYKIEDHKLKMGGPQGTVIMDILEDGTIKGPMGIPLIAIQ